MFNATDSRTKAAFAAVYEQWPKNLIYHELRISPAVEMTRDKIHIHPLQSSPGNNAKTQPTTDHNRRPCFISLHATGGRPKNSRR